MRDEWARCGQILGLTENTDKAAFFHATAASQRQLRSLQVEPDLHPKFLGVELQGAAQRRNSEKEEKRIQDSLRLLNKSRFLPLNWGEKQKNYQWSRLGQGNLGLDV